MRVVACSLPFFANAGHSSATGASRSSLPRLARTWAQSAVAPLVQEKTMLTQSFFPGAPLFWSAAPPHRSTTVSPPTVRHTEAPTSPLASKFSWKASATRSKPGLTVPSVIFSFLGRHRQLERLHQEGGGRRQAGIVDAVADALGDVKADLHAGLLQHLRGALAQHMRQHLVLVAMGQQPRRPRLDLVLQDFRPRQHAREADDAGERTGRAPAGTRA